MTARIAAVVLWVSIILPAGDARAQAQDANARPGPADSAADASVLIRFAINNASPHRIRAVYVSPSKSPGWGPSLLGAGLAPSQANALRSNGLAPGARTEIAVKGPCGAYDVRIVAEKGLEFIEDEVSLCDDSDDLVTLGRTELKRVRANEQANAPN